MLVAEGKTSTATKLERYAERAREQHLAPLWEFFKDWFCAEPRVDAIPYLWRYEELKPLLHEAASVISTAQAERRVLALENPGLGGRRLVTDALCAGLQLIIPGEIAPSHRHSPAALRFIMEGQGAYTSVSGEKAYMEPGDFIVTPSWTWHEHGNEGSGATVWMDVLDVPLIRFLGAGFSEQYAEKEGRDDNESKPDEQPQGLRRRRCNGRGVSPARAIDLDALGHYPI